MYFYLQRIFLNWTALINRKLPGNVILVFSNNSHFDGFILPDWFLQIFVSKIAIACNPIILITKKINLLDLYKKPKINFLL